MKTKLQDLAIGVILVGMVAMIFFVRAEASTGTITGWAGGANRAISKVYGQPGDATKISLSTSDGSVSLTGGVMYRFVCTIDCWYRIGSTAAVTDAPSTYMKAGQPEGYLLGLPGATVTVHAIASTTGTMEFTPVTEPADL